MQEEFSTPMMKQYLEIKKRYPDCLLFFRLGDFYEMFLEDAKVASKTLDITLTSRSRGKDGRIPMAGVPYHAVDSYLAKLIKAGFKVAICEQLEEASNAKGLVERDVVRVVTPGTVLNDKLLEKKENNFIACISFENNILGLALADLSTGNFQIAEWKGESINTIITDEISRFGFSECLIPPLLYSDPAVLKALMQNSKVSIHSVKDWEEQVTGYAAFLKANFKVKSLDGFGVSEYRVGLKSGAVLLKYLAYTQKTAISNIKKISPFRHGEFMALDRASLANLEVFSTLRDKDKNGSLVNLLDETVTAMGGRTLRDWIIKPLLSKAEINLRHEAVEEYVGKKRQRELLRDVLSEIGDVERLVSRLSLGLGNTADVHSLKESLRNVIRVSEILNDSKSGFLKRLKSHVRVKELKRVISLIDRTLIEGCPIDPKQGGIIKEGVDFRLDDLRNKISKSKTFIANLEPSERKRTGISSLKVRFNKVFGYYIEISNSNLEMVPSDYFRKQTLVNAERFITEDLKRHEDVILSSEEEIFSVEYQLFNKLVEEIISRTIDLQNAASAIASLDCILCFAYVSEKYNYTRPQLLNSLDIEIKDGRHPVVENRLEDMRFVPNDTYLSTSKDQLLIITGPNMAGKSVYVRQVAMICLMSQVGCFVPARKAKLGIIDRIFVRSGASDVIASGMSTFMVEMVETAHILNNATIRSLIVMDEVGRGTSTYDGISIAQAVAEYLVQNPANITPKTLFATHYHELQSLEAFSGQRVKNFQVAVEEVGGEPVFLHKVIPGRASHSYGIAVASLAGIPKEIIKRARAILKGLESRAGGQNGLHKSRSQIIEILNDVDIDRTTPVDALNKLQEMKGKLWEK